MVPFETIHEPISTRQAACILGVTNKRIYDLVRRGLLSVEHSNNVFLLNPHEVYALISAVQANQTEVK